MAAPLAFKAMRSCNVTLCLQQLQWLPAEKRIKQKNLTLTLKAGTGLAPSCLSELLTDFDPARALWSSDSPSLAVTKFKLKTVGYRSFCSVGFRMRNCLPHPHLAGTLASKVSTHDTVSALLQCKILATHICGLSRHSSSLPPNSVVSGSILKNGPVALWAPRLLPKNSTVRLRKISMTLCYHGTENFIAGRGGLAVRVPSTLATKTIDQV